MSRSAWKATTTTGTPPTDSTRPSSSQGEATVSFDSRGGALARTHVRRWVVCVLPEPGGVDAAGDQWWCVRVSRRSCFADRRGRRTDRYERLGWGCVLRTTQRLVAQDTDTQWDFYDARVDGGFPAPVVPAGCVGDACQGSPWGAAGVWCPVERGVRGWGEPRAARIHGGGGRAEGVDEGAEARAGVEGVLQAAQAPAARV